jgi:hypothetical protein
MSRHHNRRSFGSVSRARRARQTRAAPSALARRARRRPASASADGAVIALLSEILIGDSAWTVDEVQRLISMRESAELGQWRRAGLDDGASAR